MTATGSRPVRALIVDDEDFSRRLLRSLLARDDTVALAGEASSMEEAASLIDAQHPDLVFLDIEMRGGSGIDLLRSLPQPTPYVIFVTAHSEFTLSAFELQAIDYIVKPVEGQRFADSVARAKRRIFESRLAALAKEMADTANAVGSDVSVGLPSNRYPDHLAIRVRRRLLSLELDKITWIQGASQYSRVHAQQGEYLLTRTLGSLECELDPMRFFRVHRSAIVNAAHVREIRSCGDGRYHIYMQDGQVLPLGRARREILQKLLNGIGSRVS